MAVEGPEGRSTLPTGPHPTAGPGTIRMPRWPGPVMGIGGALLTIGALSLATIARDGDDTSLLAWLTLLGAVLFVSGLVWSAVRQLRVRRFLPPERYRGPAVLILLALVLIIASVANAPFGSDIAALLGGDGDLTLLGAAVILVSTQAALLLVSWAFVHRPNALAGLPRFPGRDPGGAAMAGLGWGLVAWFGATLLGALVVALLNAVGLAPEPQAAEQALELLEPWIVVPAVVIVAPIAEEVFFRGVVFNAWLREGGRRWAFLGSSALFAVIHLSLASFVPIFVLGLALAWIYDRTGNLIAPIVMHAVVNGISVALALLVRYSDVQLPV